MLERITHIHQAALLYTYIHKYIYTKMGACGTETDRPYICTYVKDDDNRRPLKTVIITGIQKSQH